MKNETKTLIIEMNGPDKRVQVPADATVTFGGLIPGAKVDGGSNRTALRVYQGKRQIAVFTGVQGFRFLDDITVLEKRTQQAAKSVMVEEDGVQKSRNVTVTTEDWVNPDAITDKSSTAAVEKALMLKDC